MGTGDEVRITAAGGGAPRALERLALRRRGLVVVLARRGRALTDPRAVASVVGIPSGTAPRTCRRSVRRVEVRTAMPTRTLVASPCPGAAAVRQPLPWVRRTAKHPWLMHYNRLAALVLLANAGVLAVSAWRGSWAVGDGTAASGLSAMVVVNIAGAVLIRQQHVWNALLVLVSRTPGSWPLRLRWGLSKIYHVGGLHVGAAIAGALWLVASTVVATTDRAIDPGSTSGTALVLAWALTALLVVITVCALPPMRVRHHDLFEATHRAGGWAAVALFWPLTVERALARPSAGAPLTALLTSWQVWVLLVVTASVALPWLRLRRVPITVEHRSGHAALVRLDYGVTPPVVATMSISRHPLRDWHTFATVRVPGHTGYRLLVSRAGDWTGRFVDDPPTHVWVKGVPASSVLEMEVLFSRIVYVATGSGIGPLLGQVLEARVPARLIWSARSPRTTYGDDLVDRIEAAQPGALIWDTAVSGKPDLPRLTRQACEESDAEAVVVVSNKATTWSVVHGVERLGIPAVGPIFDS